MHKNIDYNAVSGMGRRAVPFLKVGCYILDRLVQCEQVFRLLQK